MIHFLSYSAEDTIMSHPRNWMEVREEGLYCVAADAYIDPVKPVERAIVTHGHADHARSGHGTVYATPDTLDIMRIRYGENCAETFHPLEYGEVLTLDKTSLTLHPAGHILGSAQVLLEHDGGRIIITGDYKRRHDPTCEPFYPVKCDVLVTEATFGLPVFTHPPIEDEIEKLLQSMKLFPNKTHLVGVYALGKCQRLMIALREAGYSRTIYLHGALVKLCELYESKQIDLGRWEAVGTRNKKELQGELILGPPSAITDKWSRGFGDCVKAVASGWMQIRARARQRRVELPLIISDHADWPELTQTLDDVGAPEIWVTHGREEALVHYAETRGYKAQALSLLGYEEDHD